MLRKLFSTGRISYIRFYIKVEQSCQSVDLRLNDSGKLSFVLLVVLGCFLWNGGISGLLNVIACCNEHTSPS